MKAISLKEAQELINASFSEFFHLYDVLFYKNKDWQDELKKQEKVYELIQKVNDIEHYTGISRLETQIANKEEFMNWLHEDRASMVLNYNRELPDDMYQVLDEKILEIKEELKDLNDEVESLRKTYYVELDDEKN